MGGTEAVVGLACHGDVGCSVEHRVQPLPHQRVVIDEQDRDWVGVAHGASIGSGKHARTVPPSRAPSLNGRETLDGRDDRS